MALRDASNKVSLLGVPFRVWVQGHQFSYQYTQPSSYYIANVRISTGQIAPKATRCSGGACSLEVLTDVERGCPKGQISPNQRSRRPLASAHDASRMAPDVEKRLSVCIATRPGSASKMPRRGWKGSRTHGVTWWTSGRGPASISPPRAI